MLFICYLYFVLFYFFVFICTWFERLSMIAIVANSLTLAMVDHCNIACTDTRCKSLRIAEFSIFAFFTIEMAIKMLAMGIFGSETAYLANPWNRFDFFVIVTGTIEYLFSEYDINLSAIRSLRMLGPLRAVKRIPSLRLLVTWIIDILPMLGSVLGLCLFIFFVFGIIAVQLWSGLTRQRCFFPKDQYPKPPDYMPPYYQLEDEDFVCSLTSGMRTCDQIPYFETHNSMCLQLFADDEEKLNVCSDLIRNYTDCRPSAVNSRSDSVSFDNIGYASLAIFQVISLQGWVKIMYLTQDAFSFWTWIYFVILVLIGSYFAVKLSLVVIATQFTETSQRERDSELKKKRKVSRSATLTTDEKSGLYQQIIDLIIHLFKSYFKKMSESVPIQVKPTIFTSGLMTIGKNSNDNYKSKHSGLVFSKLKKIRAFARFVVDHSKFQCVFSLLIVFNAVIMGLEHYEQPIQLTKFIETSNLVFTAVFLIELVIRFYAYGPYLFIREAFNMLDTIVILINLIDVLGSQQGIPGISVLRLFRLVRLVKILRFFPVLQQQLMLMLHTVDNIAVFFLLFSLFVFVTALLGMSLFGCKFCHSSANPVDYNSTEIYLERIINAGNFSWSTVTSTCSVAVVEKPWSEEAAGHIYADDCPDANFDTLFHSAFTVLQIFTHDGWTEVMKNGMKATTTWASLYFVFLVTAGDYILFNLLIGILVEGFSAKQQAALEMFLEKQATASTSKTKDDDNEPRKSCQLSCWNLKYFFDGCGSDRSLFLFSPNFTYRQNLIKIVTHPFYDFVFLFITLANCLVIAMERPSIKDESIERMQLTIANNIFSVLFMLDSAMKIVASGFLLNKNAYLRSPWNFFDFSLVVLAAFDLALSVAQMDGRNKVILSTLRPIRLLRVLRPLRLISRAKGMRTVLKALALSVKPVVNIMVICTFFFVVFAILGVQLFKGCYSKCIPPEDYGHLVLKNTSNNTQTDNESRNTTEADIHSVLLFVKSRGDCLHNGLVWHTDQYNFDSLPNAMMTLFVFATLDGWTDISRIGVQCISPNLQPVHYENLWSYTYFIGFLFFVCFFAMNMFGGVMVNNFQRVKNQLDLEELLAQSRRNSERLSMGLAESTGRPSASVADEFWLEYPKWRCKLYKIVSHRYFEVLVMFIVCISVLAMAVESYDMSKRLNSILDKGNHVILILLVAEIISKMVAFGVGRYFGDKWNSLDFFVTLGSVFGFLLDELNSEVLLVDPSVVKIARIFRIARILKLVRKAKNLNRLLDTAYNAMPQILHLSVLFTLLLFIYAALGVQLYGRFDCTFEKCEALSRHANFANFGIALLTLFRVFTVDDWGRILNDVSRMSKKDEFCKGEAAEAFGVSCQLIHILSPVYFVSFILLSEFVLLNIVVAVLMQQIESSQSDSHAKAKVEQQLKEEEEEESNIPDEAVTNDTQNIQIRKAIWSSEGSSNLTPVEFTNKPFYSCGRRFILADVETETVRGIESPSTDWSSTYTIRPMTTWRQIATNNSYYLERHESVKKRLGNKKQLRCHGNDGRFVRTFTTLAELHRRRMVSSVTQSSSVTWTITADSPICLGPDISEGLSECETVQFDTLN